MAMENNNYVYLSGPMAGLSFEEALNGWRKTAAARLIDHDIIGLNPGRGKEDTLKEVKDLPKIGIVGKGLLATNKGITVRDYYDLKRSQFMLLNLTGAKAVGIGSMIEVGWAHALGIPIILVMEEYFNIHEHAILNSLVSIRTQSLDEALGYIISCVDTDCQYSY